jgi:hypothetical protein
MILTSADASDRVQAAILTRIAGSVVLIGTTESLAGAFGVTVTVLLSALRELLEAGRITVQMEPRGQVSVRVGDRYTALADRPI